jgi:hypothetical protein
LYDPCRERVKTFFPEKNSLNGRGYFFRKKPWRNLALWTFPEKTA